MPAYPHLSAADQHALLASIVARCTHVISDDDPKRTPVVVFDLDGTLLDNRPRTLAILKELGEACAAHDADFAARLTKMGENDLEYLVTDTLKKNGITQTDLVAVAERYWSERFFGDDHLKHDVPLAGAVEFARACYDAGGTLVYMTGRDLPLMGIGSFRSLRDCGFPIGVPGTELVLKPDAAIPDEAYKRLEGPKLSRVGDVIAIFDNEPANCNTLLALHPRALSVLVDTQHLPGAPAIDPRVQVIADFVMR
jgi:hypothetical protein